MKTRPLNAVLRQGFVLLYEIIKTEDHEQLADRVCTAILSGLAPAHRGSLRSDWIDKALTEEVQDERREQWCSQHNSAQDIRRKVTFHGDRLESPPHAWIVYWKK